MKVARLLLQAVVPLANLLDRLVLLTRGAEPDMEVGSLYTELFGEIGNFHTGVSSGFQSGENFGSQVATGSTLGGLLRGLGGLSLSGRSTWLSLGSTHRLTRDDAGHVGLDPLDFLHKCFPLIHEGGKLVKSRGGKGRDDVHKGRVL